MVRVDGIAGTPKGYDKAEFEDGELFTPVAVNTVYQPPQRNKTLFSTA